MTPQPQLQARPPAPSTPAARLREARRWLDDNRPAAGPPDSVDRLTPALTPLLGEVLARSWQRSRQAGLATSGRASAAPHASAAQLARAMQRQYTLISHAQPVLDYIGMQVAGSQSLLILADAQGMLLRCLGDAGFVGRAERVALRPGAHWAEAHRGTNAIGTALAEAQPVVVRGGEHYLARNGFLTCSAAPIMDPAGRLMGVFDISGDHRGHHPHTLGLARAAACMVEHRLFDTWHGGGLRMRLQAQAGLADLGNLAGLATLANLGDGLLAFTEDGLLIGANSAALRLLGLARQAIGQVHIHSLLATDLRSLLDWAHAGAATAHAVAPPGSAALCLRVEGGRRPGVGLIAAPQAALAANTTVANRPWIDPPASDALAALDTGDSAMQAAVQRARRVAGKPIALLLQGESGVGKEVFARAAHASGPRAGKPFVAVNCAALPETLIEAELFGYQSGAFTGARREGASGRIREAHGGTLFLDEIGDMPLAMQARLLRVLQERAVVPLGGGKPVAVDFSLVCATHHKLREAMDKGLFRADLYYRLNGLTLHLPPLRERSDFAGLVAQLLAEIAPETGKTGGLVLHPALAPLLAAHRWPGNLRQLHNALRTAAALLADGEHQITEAHLPDDLADDLHAARAGATAGATAGPDPLPANTTERLRQHENQTVARMVQVCHGNVSEAARRLGISRNTLYRKLGPIQA